MSFFFKQVEMDPKQLFPDHFESVFGKNEDLFPRELKKKYSKGIKKSIIPKGIKQVLFQRPFLNM